MQGVTPQAVYKLLKTHEIALKGHVLKAKRGTELDEFAVAYLLERMIGNTVVVADRVQQDEIERLKTELKAAQDELILKNNMLLAAQNQVLQLTANRNEELKAAEDLQQQLRDELNRFQPSWFGLYRKK